eukprot:gene5889-7333_t
MYQTFYFGTLLLTFLCYPLLGSFVMAGDFHLTERIKSAVRENMLMYLIFGVIGLLVMIWLLIIKRLDWNSMVGYVMAMANTWGLFLVIMFLGYGLVETPRSIWIRSNRELMLKHLQFKAVDLVNSQKKYYDEMMTVLKAIKKIADQTRKYDPYEKYVKIILDQCPEEYKLVQTGEGTGEVTYSTLVSLNSKLKDTVTNYNRSLFLYEQCCLEAFELQDIGESNLNLDKVVTWSFKEPRTHRFASQFNYAEWIWYNYLEKPVLRVLALVFAIFSVIILWSEISVSVTSADVSILSNIVKHSNVSNLGIQIIVFFPLGYEALTAYSTLFKIRIFNYYRLIPHQHSDPNSILFSASYLCRLAAPLCFNFIQFIHAQTTFSKVMGTMDVAPFLGTYFYIYFPLLIIIVCLATLFNLYSRIMNCLNINRFRFDQDFNHDQIDEGKFLLNSERSKWTSRKRSTLPSDQTPFLSSNNRNSSNNSVSSGSGTTTPTLSKSSKTPIISSSTSAWGKSKINFTNSLYDEDDEDDDLEIGGGINGVSNYNSSPINNSNSRLSGFPNIDQMFGRKSSNNNNNNNSKFDKQSLLKK